MRKSFTQLFSVLTLICVFGFQALAQSPFDGTKSVPVQMDGNVNPADIATQFVVAFSDAPTITAAGGTLVVYEGESTVLKAIPINNSNANVQVVDNTLVVKHGIASFKEETVYQITLSASAVTVDGNAVAIPSGNWMFRTGDFTAPKLVDTDPLAPVGSGVNATMKIAGNPAEPFELVLNFDEDVLVGEGNIAIYEENGTVVELIDVTTPEVISIDGGEATVAVAANARFKAGMNYYVRVDAGAFTDDVSDYSTEEVEAVANAFVGIKDNTTWTFTTRDNSAPEVTLTVTNVTGTSAKLNVTLSEDGEFDWYVKVKGGTQVATGNVAAVEADVAEEVAVSGLTGGMTYLAYVVASNDLDPVNTTELADAMEAAVEFSTADNTAPIALDRGTVDTDKKTTGAYVIFDEKVKGAEGTLSLRKKSNNELVATIDAATVTSTQIPDDAEENAEDWKVVFDFGVELASNVEYYIVFPNGYIQDMFGNEYKNTVASGLPVPVSANDWVITSSDFEAPEVAFTTTTKTTPTTSNITGAANTDNISIHFNETVLPNMGDASWAGVSGYTAWSKYVAFKKDGVTVDAAFSYVGDAIVINPVANLESNAVYTVVLRPGAVKDASDYENVLAAEQMITVTTGDNEAAVYAFGPTADNLQGYTPLTITFEKDVFVKDGETKAALTTEALKTLITLEKVGGDAVAAADLTIVYDAATMTATITPVDGKPFTTSVCGEAPVQYTLTLDDADLVDSKMAAFTGAGAMTYDVADYVAPTVTLLTGDNEISDMTTNATVKFNEVVEPISAFGDDPDYLAHFTLKSGSVSGKNLPFTVTTSDNMTFTIVPDGWTWEENTTYYYGVGASMQDACDNVAPATYGTFTVVPDEVAPTVMATTYQVNGGAALAIDKVATDVKVNGDDDIVVKVTFNMNVDDKDLTTVNTVTSTFVDAGSAPISDEIVSGDIDGSVLTITIADPVIPAAAGEYTITIPAGLVEGNSTYNGTDFAQLTEDVTITVTTADLEAPEIVSNNVDALPSVPVDFTELTEKGLELTFSEPVELGSGKITLKEGTTTEQTITVGASNVTIAEDGMTALVDVAPLKKYNTEYTVTVEKAVFEDKAGNTVAANYVFTLTTEVNPQPVVVEDGLYPADNSDLVPSGEAINLTMEFSEEVLEASEVGSRKLVYVFERTSGTTRASFDENLDIDNGDDNLVYFAYVELEKVSVSTNLVTVSGVTLEADKNYYVLVTPGAFKDKSAGVGTESNPVPGLYEGIVSSETWNFSTSNVNAPEVELAFTKLGADELVATDSDIEIKFSKPIVKANDAAITNAEIPTLITLTKDPSGDATEIEFTGTISADRMTITIDNSSLVLLGEMVGSTEYEVSFEASVLKVEDTEINLGAWNDTFTTSDYTKPVKPSFAFTTGNEVADVFFGQNSDEEDVHQAKVTLTDESEGDAAMIYYLWTADLTTAYTAQMVMDLGVALEVGKDITGSKDLLFDENMESETEYRLVAIAVDAAGNISDLGEFTYITDDVVAPELEGDLPVAFNMDEELSLVFNEDVAPATADANTYARVIDANGVVYKAPLANLTGDDADANVITIVLSAAGLPISDDVASYTVEIDPGMIVDVPRDVDAETAGNQMANTPNAFAGILGTSFVVSSDDEVNPELVTAEPNEEDVPLNPTFTLTFSEDVELGDDFTQFVIYEEAVYDAMLKAGKIMPSGNPYDVLTADNISIDGKVVTITSNRELVSGEFYYLVISGGTFNDMVGNPWIGEGTEEMPENVTLWFRGEDNVAPTAMFQAGTTDLPSETELESVPSELIINFNEDIFINTEDDNVNTYELQSHVYLLNGETAVPFMAAYGEGAITLYVDADDLEKGETYTFGYTNVYDDEGNLAEGESESFTIAVDAVTPLEVVFTPGDNDPEKTTWVDITVDQVFTVEFSGVIFSYHGTDESLNNLILTAEKLQEMIDSETAPLFTLTDAELEVVSYTEADGKSVLTLKATEELASETAYVLALNEDLIQIGQGYDPLPAFTEHFMTADVTAPKLVADVEGEILPEAYQPVNDGVVGKSQTLALVFDEEVVGAGAITIHRWDGAVAATIDVTGAASEEVEGGWMIDLVDLTEAMAANENLVTNESYYVIIPAGAITDVATTPNDYAGITTINEWKFDLRDDSNPVPTFVQNGMDNVVVDTDIDITFDRDVVMDWGWLAIYEEVDGDAVQLIRIDDDVDMVEAASAYSFDIDELMPNTKYYVELGKGSFVLAADETTPQEQVEIGEWWFSTEIDAAPEAITFQPAHEDELTYGVLPMTDLVITFDQNVVAGTGNIQLHNRKTVGDNIVTSFDVTDATKVIFDGMTLTIPAAELGLMENSEYYVIIPGTAVRNNTSTPDYWEGIVTPLEWSFSTVVDGAAPVVETLSPDEVTTEDNHPVFEMVFDENVQLTETGGSIHVTLAGEETAVLDIPLTADMIVDNVITIEYEYDAEVGGLDKNADYFVTVDADAIQDMTGNVFAGISDAAEWTFTTGADFATGVEDPVDGSLEFKVYPNPFDSYVTVENADKLSRVIITNVAGQRVKEIANPTETIQTGDLRSGLYIITLVTKDDVVAKTERIVKR